MAGEQQPSAYSGSGNPYAPAYQFSTDNLRPGFNTTPAQQEFQSPQHSHGRRSSITSTSSSSGASLSPVVEHSPAPAFMQSASAPMSPGLLQSTGNVVMDELALRARQMAGVTSALPAGADGTSAFSAQPHPAKLPIPRLQRAASGLAVSTAPTKRKSAPSPPSPNNGPALSPTTPATVTNLTASGRPKTSHTTIERRYRTNLNARIQSLRNAVPALRVLEQKDGNRVGNLNLKAGTRKGEISADSDVADVVDERGFVDGVKVARKGSKANVLGKAVEYIHVLKRRELRLKREQDGLRALIVSLEGGSSLLKAWESMWREKYGGPESDEVEGEEVNEADDENDDEDDEDLGEDGEDDGEEGSGKKRKRPKVEPKTRKENVKKAAAPAPVASAMAAAGVPGQPEKRKRGRPRKIVPPPPIIPASMENPAHDVFMSSQAPAILVSTPLQDATMHDMLRHSQGMTQQDVMQQQQPHMQVQAQPGQYLLAAFAFFSFFNSPASDYMASYSGKSEDSHVHTHTGAVLGARSALPFPRADLAFGWRDALQVVHLLVSFLLLVSIVTPWLPRVLRVPVSWVIPRPLKPLFGAEILSSTESTAASDAQKEESSARVRLVDALRYRDADPQNEVHALRDALGLISGTWGLMFTVADLMGQLAFGSARRTLERKVLEQKVALRLTESVAMDTKAPWTERAQTYLIACKYISVRSASPGELATLALVIRPVWHAKSISLWALASRRIKGDGNFNSFVHKPYESLVLTHTSVDEAAERMVSIACPRGSEARSPLSTLAGELVREHIRKEAESAFERAVLGEADDDDRTVTMTPMDMGVVVAAGRSLMGRDAKLADLFERVCDGAVDADVNAIFDQDLAGADDEDEQDEHAEIRALLHAVALYRRIFDAPLAPSAPASPRVPFPPSSAAAIFGGASATVSAFASGYEDADCRTPKVVPRFQLAIPSPPPSPARRSSSHVPVTSAAVTVAACRLALRRCLDSSAFDRRDVLEDARDRVVDCLTAEH